MRIQTTAPLFLLALASCSSTEPTRSAAPPVRESVPQDVDSTGVQAAEDQATAVETVDRFAPLETPVWTGAFSERTLLLARSIRIEGPEHLLAHIALASDDKFFERAVESTPNGLLHVVRRASDEVQVVRATIDAWRLAAETQISVLQRGDDGPVRVIASGNVMWRDIDGNLVRGERVELLGEPGNMEPLRPRVDQHEPAAEPVTEPVAEPVGSVPGVDTPAAAVPSVGSSAAAGESSERPDGAQPSDAPADNDATRRTDENSVPSNESTPDVAPERAEPAGDENVDAEAGSTGVPSAETAPQSDAR